MPHTRPLKSGPCLVVFRPTGAQRPGTVEARVKPAGGAAPQTTAVSDATETRVALDHQACWNSSGGWAQQVRWAPSQGGPTRIPPQHEPSAGPRPPKAASGHFRGLAPEAPEANHIVRSGQARGVDSSQSIEEDLPEMGTSKKKGNKKQTPWHQNRNSTPHRESRVDLTISRPGKELCRFCLFCSICPARFPPGKKKKKKKKINKKRFPKARARIK